MDRFGIAGHLDVQVVLKVPIGRPFPERADGSSAEQTDGGHDIGVAPA